MHSTEATRALDELLDYPNLFVFRVVGAADADLEAACRRAVLQHLERPAEATEVKPSAGGKWVSVRLAVTVVSADEIRGLYAFLHALPGVRMVL